MATVDQEAAKAQFLAERNNFVDLLDLHLEDIGEGTARLRMPYRAEVTNGTGGVHGGAIVSLCDTTFYIALASIYGRDQETTTASLSCNFLAPAIGPDDLIADARVLKSGKRIVYGEVYVRSGDRLIAHATLNFLNTNRA